jgi:hypothetical protein
MNELNVSTITESTELEDNFAAVAVGAALLDRLPPDATHGDLRALVAEEMQQEQARIAKLLESAPQ